MRCPTCDGTGITKGYDAILKRFFDMKCFDCDGTGEVDHIDHIEEEPQEQTNKEWLRSCSTEELAEFMARQCMCSIGEYECGSMAKCKKEYWLAWLQEKHND